MFRLWGKLIKDNRILEDAVIENDSTDTRTHKVFDALDSLCQSFDLSRPIWLDANVSEFQRYKKTRFFPDNFMEAVDFDFLEIQILEED